jgi:hypothetical protein
MMGGSRNQCHRRPVRLGRATLTYPRDHGSCSVPRHISFKFKGDVCGGVQGLFTSSYIELLVQW